MCKDFWDTLYSAVQKSSRALALLPFFVDRLCSDISALINLVLRQEIIHPVQFFTLFHMELASFTAVVVLIFLRIIRGKGLSPIKRAVIVTLKELNVFELRICIQLAIKKNTDRDTMNDVVGE